MKTTERYFSKGIVLVDFLNENSSRNVPTILFNIVDRFAVCGIPGGSEWNKAEYLPQSWIPA